MNINTTDIALNVTELQKKTGLVHVLPENFGISKKLLTKGDLIEGKPEDFVDKVDIAVENMIKSTLLSFVPGSGWLGEETSQSAGDGRFVWIVDPTDGTAVYSNGGEYYSNAIALVDKKARDGKGSVIFSSVYQPPTGRQFVSIDNRAFVRQTISFPVEGYKTITRIPNPSQSKGFGEWLGCSFGTSKYYKDHLGVEELVKKPFEKEEDLILKRKYGAIDARPYSGSSALFACDIADGNRHFAVLFFQKAWDVASGATYAKKAGCPVIVFNNDGSVNETADLDNIIAYSDKKTTTNVGVFANEFVRDKILEKMYK